MKNLGLRCSKTEKGASMVEMAVALPVFMAILFGIIQWGFIFAANITVRNAAAVGARAAALYGGQNQSAVQAAVLNSLVPLPPSGLSSVNYSGGGAGTDQTVTVNYSLALFFPFVVPGHISGQKAITATSIMR